MIARAKSSKPIGRERRCGVANAGAILLEIDRCGQSRRSSKARSDSGRSRFPSASAVAESCASLRPALPVKQLAEPELVAIACRRPAPDALLRHDQHRRRLNAIGGEHPGGRDRRNRPRSARGPCARGSLRNPALTPAKRKPRTGAGSSRTFIGSSRRRYYRGLTRRKVARLRMTDCAIE